MSNVAAIETIKQHIPSISDEDEQDIIDNLFDDDVAGLARRTCHCGLRIDGFYEYVEHLIDLFGGSK